MGSVYKLDCDRCHRTVTVPAIDRIRLCPNCGASLCIMWNAAHVEVQESRK
jgi:hypothetical protein